MKTRKVGLNKCYKAPETKFSGAFILWLLC
nr:MAG TPA: hypothetical protein [Caudoviricetes sp.]